MSAISVLREAISIFAHRLPYLLVVGAAVYLPTTLAVAWLSEGDPESFATIADELRWSSLGETLLGAFAIAFAALATASIKLGDGDSFPELLGRTLRCWPAVIGVSLLWNLGVALGFVALILPGVWLMLSWAVVTPAVALGDAGVIGCFGYSYALMQGRRGTVLLLTMLFVLGFFVAAIVLYVPIALLPPTLAPAADIAAEVLLSVGMLLWSCAMTVLYLNARAEEYDLPLPDHGAPAEGQRYEVVTDQDNPFRAPSI